MRALVYLCWTVVLLSCGSISLWFQVQKKGVLHWCPSMVQDWMYNLSLLEFLTDPTMADYLGKFTPLFVGPNEQELKGILASFPRTTREALLTKRMVDTFPDPVRALLTGNDGADRAERFSARSKDLLRDCEESAGRVKPVSSVDIINSQILDSLASLFDRFKVRQLKIGSAVFGVCWFYYWWFVEKVRGGRVARRVGGASLGMGALLSLVGLGLKMKKGSGKGRSLLRGFDMYQNVNGKGE